MLLVQSKTATHTITHSTIFYLFKVWSHSQDPTDYWYYILLVQSNTPKHRINQSIIFHMFKAIQPLIGSNTLSYFTCKKQYSHSQDQTQYYILLVQSKTATHRIKHSKICTCSKQYSHYQDQPQHHILPVQSKRATHRITHSIILYRFKAIQPHIVSNTVLYFTCSKQYSHSQDQTQYYILLLRSNTLLIGSLTVSYFTCPKQYSHSQDPTEHRYYILLVQSNTPKYRINQSIIFHMFKAIKTLIGSNTVSYITCSKQYSHSQDPTQYYILLVQSNAPTNRIKQSIIFYMFKAIQPLI